MPTSQGSFEIATAIFDLSGLVAVLGRELKDVGIQIASLGHIDKSAVNCGCSRALRVGRAWLTVAVLSGLVVLKMSVASRIQS
jgi:hypothetical protein